jgi:glutamyl-tRNA reductase
MSSVNIEPRYSAALAPFPEDVRMLFNMGVSYKRASLATLDSLTLRDPLAFYKLLRSIPGIEGAVIVQTCNRVDLFIECRKDAAVSDKILRSWTSETKFRLETLRSLVDERTSEEVLRYLISLASGLESMLVGETQILGQLKSSLIEARGLAASSPELSKAFEMSLAAGAKIRNETGIGRGTVSLGSAALKLAEETLGPLQQAKVLLLGTGEIGMLLMKTLKARGIHDVTVASRTRQRTESFCRTYGGSPLDIKSALSQLEKFRLVLVATRASNFVLTKESVLPHLDQGGEDKRMILDLSIPRNVSPEIADVKGIVTRTIDDLRDITDQAAFMRKALLREAEPMVEEAIKKISSLLRRNEAEPVVSDLYQRADKIRREELAKTLSKLDLPQQQSELIEKMSQSLVRKILAQPTLNLREAAKKGDTRVLTVAGQIFEGE